MKIKYMQCNLISLVFYCKLSYSGTCLMRSLIMFYSIYANNVKYCM